MSNDVCNKYSNPPTKRPWDKVSDSSEFVSDVDLLYNFCLLGNPRAIHTLLVIGTYTDGALSEGMPSLFKIVDRYYIISSYIINNDSRLYHHYGHWLDR